MQLRAIQRPLLVDFLTFLQILELHIIDRGILKLPDASRVPANTHTLLKPAGLDEQLSTRSWRRNGLFLRFYQDTMFTQSPVFIPPPSPWCFRFFIFLFPLFLFSCPSSPDFVPDSWLCCFPPPGLCSFSKTNVKPVFSSWFDSVEVWCLHVQIFAVLSDFFCLTPLISLSLSFSHFWPCLSWSDSFLTLKGNGTETSSHISHISLSRQGRCLISAGHFSSPNTSSSSFLFFL